MTKPLRREAGLWPVGLYRATLPTMRDSEQVGFLYVAASAALEDAEGVDDMTSLLKVGYTRDPQMRLHVLKHGKEDKGPCAGMRDWRLVWLSAPTPNYQRAERDAHGILDNYFPRLYEKYTPEFGHPKTNGESEIFVCTLDGFRQVLSYTVPPGMDMEAAWAVLHLAREAESILRWREYDERHFGRT